MKKKLLQISAVVLVVISASVCLFIANAKSNAKAAQNAESGNNLYDTIGILESATNFEADFTSGNTFKVKSELVNYQKYESDDFSSKKPDGQWGATREKTLYVVVRNIGNVDGRIAFAREDGRPSEEISSVTNSSDFDLWNKDHAVYCTNGGFWYEGDPGLLSDAPTCPSSPDVYDQRINARTSKVFEIKPDEKWQTPNCVRGTQNSTDSDAKIEQTCRTNVTQFYESNFNIFFAAECANLSAQICVDRKEDCKDGELNGKECVSISERRTAFDFFVTDDIRLAETRDEDAKVNDVNCISDGDYMGKSNSTKTVASYSDKVSCKISIQLPIASSSNTNPIGTDFKLALQTYGYSNEAKSLTNDIFAKAGSDFSINFPEYVLDGWTDGYAPGHSFIFSLTPSVIKHDVVLNVSFLAPKEAGHYNLSLYTHPVGDWHYEINNNWGWKQSFISDFFSADFSNSNSEYEHNENSVQFTCDTFSVENNVKVIYSNYSNGNPGIANCYLFRKLNTQAGEVRVVPSLWNAKYSEDNTHFETDGNKVAIESLNVFRSLSLPTFENQVSSASFNDANHENVIAFNIDLSMIKEGLYNFKLSDSQFKSWANNGKYVDLPNREYFFKVIRNDETISNDIYFNNNSASDDKSMFSNDDFCVNYGPGSFSESSITNSIVAFNCNILNMNKNVGPDSPMSFYGIDVYHNGELVGPESKFDHLNLTGLYGENIKGTVGETGKKWIWHTTQLYQPGVYPSISGFFSEILGQDIDDMLGEWTFRVTEYKDSNSGSNSQSQTDDDQIVIRNSDTLDDKTLNLTAVQKADLSFRIGNANAIEPDYSLSKAFFDDAKKVCSINPQFKLRESTISKLTADEANCVNSEKDKKDFISSIEYQKLSVEVIYDIIINRIEIEKGGIDKCDDSEICQHFYKLEHFLSHHSNDRNREFPTTAKLLSDGLINITEYYEGIKNLDAYLDKFYTAYEKAARAYTSSVAKVWKEQNGGDPEKAYRAYIKNYFETLPKETNNNKINYGNWNNFAYLRKLYPNKNASYNAQFSSKEKNAAEVFEYSKQYNSDFETPINEASSYCDNTYLYINISVKCAISLDGENFKGDWSFKFEVPDYIEVKSSSSYFQMNGKYAEFSGSKDDTIHNSGWVNWDLEDDNYTGFDSYDDDSSLTFKISKKPNAKISDKFSPEITFVNSNETKIIPNKFGTFASPNITIGCFNSKLVASETDEWTNLFYCQAARDSSIKADLVELNLNDNGSGVKVSSYSDFSASDSSKIILGFIPGQEIAYFAVKSKAPLSDANLEVVDNSGYNISIQNDFSTIGQTCRVEHRDPRIVNCEFTRTNDYGDVSFNATAEFATDPDGKYTPFSRKEEIAFGKNQKTAASFVLPPDNYPNLESPVFLKLKISEVSNANYFVNNPSALIVMVKKPQIRNININVNDIAVSKDQEIDFNNLKYEVKGSLFEGDTLRVGKIKIDNRPECLSSDSGIKKGCLIATDFAVITQINGYEYENFGYKLVFNPGDIITASSNVASVIENYLEYKKSMSPIIGFSPSDKGSKSQVFVDSFYELIYEDVSYIKSQFPEIVDEYNKLKNEWGSSYKHLQKQMNGLNYTCSNVESYLKVGKHYSCTVIPDGTVADSETNWSISWSFPKGSEFSIHLPEQYENGLVSKEEKVQDNGDLTITYTFKNGGGYSEDRTIFGDACNSPNIIDSFGKDMCWDYDGEYFTADDRIWLELTLNEEKVNANISVSFDCPPFTLDGPRIFGMNNLGSFEGKMMKFKFMFKTILSISIFALIVSVLVFVDVKEDNNSDADEISIQNQIQKLNGVVYSSKPNDPNDLLAEISDSSDEVKNKLLLKDSSNHPNLPFSDQSELSKMDFGEVVEDKIDQLNNMSNLPKAQADRVAQIKNELSKGLTSSLDKIGDETVFKFTPNDLSILSKYFGISFADGLRRMTNSNETFAISNNDLMNATEKSGIFDDNGDLAIRYVMWTNLGIYNSHPYAIFNYGKPNQWRPTEGLPTDSETMESNTLDLCEKFGKEKVDGATVRFVDQIKEFDNWWNESTGEMTEDFSVTCSPVSQTTLGIVSAGLAANHSVKVAGIAFKSGDLTQPYSIQSLRRLLKNFDLERDSAVSNIIIASITLVITIVLTIYGGAQLAGSIAGVLLSAIASLGVFAAEPITVGVVAGWVISALFLLGGIAGDLYYITSSVLEGNNLRQLDGANTFIIGNPKIYTVNIEDIVDVKPGELPEIGNFSFVNEPFTQGTPIIHYINPGETEKTLMYPESSSFQRCLTNLIRIDQNEIHNGAEIWLSSSFRDGSNKTATEHFTYNNESAYKAGYVTEGTPKHPDSRMYLVGFSNNSFVFFNQLREFINQNAGDVANDFEKGSASDVERNKTPNFFERLTFLARVENLGHGYYPTDSILRYYDDILNYNGESSQTFIFNEREDISYQGITQNTGEDDTDYSLRLVNSVTATKLSLYLIIYTSYILRGSDSNNYDMYDSIIQKAYGQLWKILHIADNKNQFFTDGADDFVGNKTDYFTLICPNIPQNQENQSVVCNLVRNNNNPNAETVYLHTQDGDIVSIGGGVSSCSEFTNRNDSHNVPVSFANGSGAASINVCIKGKSPVGKLAFAVTDVEKSTNYNLVGMINVYANNISKVNCLDSNSSEDLGFGDEVTCEVTRLSDSNSQEYTALVKLNESGVAATDSVTVSFEKGELTKSFKLGNWKNVDLKALKGKSDDSSKVNATLLTKTPYPLMERNNISVPPPFQDLSFMKHIFVLDPNPDPEL